VLPHLLEQGTYMTTFVVGDIHGRARALEEVFLNSGFDKTTDTLIVLGDIVDGGLETARVFDILETVEKRIIITGNHDCLTPDAEALTKRGWLHYNELIDDDLVYSFDVIKEIGVWMPINKIIVKHHDGNTIKVNTNRCKMQVTPTHRVLCKQRSTNHLWSEFKYIYANDFCGRIKIPSTINTACSEYNISDNEIKLTAWILTDGFIEKKYGYITLYQSKQNFVKEIDELLNNLNYEYVCGERDRKITEICGKTLINPMWKHYEFRISAKSSRKIHDYISKKIEMPLWIYNLSSRQFNIFLSTLINGNGTFYNRGNNTTSILYGREDFLKNVQGVCATKGYTATMVFDNRGDPRLNICENKTIEFDCYKSISDEYYCGKVWCINTPLSNFMVRQNGTYFFTGNCWALNWMHTGQELPVWVHQGGYATMRSYDFKWMNVPKSHRVMIEKSKYYYIDNENRIYVHGGFNPIIPIYRNKTDFLTWDRTLIDYAKEHTIAQFSEVFIGHTTTQLFRTDKPVHLHNLWMLDTGAGWNGKLTIMDVDTKEYWQSKTQYPWHIDRLLTDDEFRYGV
jgi:serine/threonine protein phosphatase 1